MGHPTYHVNVIKLKINGRLYGQVGYPTYLHVNRPLTLRPHESFTRCISFLLTYASHKLAPTFLKTQKLYTVVLRSYTLLYSKIKMRGEKRRVEVQFTHMQKSFDT